jgi:hypothetical protein
MTDIMSNVENLTPRELLALHGWVMDELRTRGILRSANNPTGDLAEYLFCKAFGWKQATNAFAHLDAIGEDGTRYQIKSRRLIRLKGSRELSAIRDLNGRHFDVLAGVLFSKDYGILRAALIPYAIVASRSTFARRINGHKFFLREDVWDAPGVQDVTAKLEEVLQGQS